jgi:hypothetical protein
MHFAVVSSKSAPLTAPTPVIIPSAGVFFTKSSALLRLLCAATIKDPYSKKEFATQNLATFSLSDCLFYFLSFAIETVRF